MQLRRIFSNPLCVVLADYIEQCSNPCDAGEAKLTSRNTHEAKEMEPKTPDSASWVVNDGIGMCDIIADMSDMRCATRGNRCLITGSAGSTASQLQKC